MIQLVSSNPDAYTPLPFVTQGRLTLQQGTAVPTTDQTGASIAWLCPYRGNIVSLYNGSWQLQTFSEIGIDISGITSGSNYDLFGYWNGNYTPVALRSSPTTSNTSTITLPTNQTGDLLIVVATASGNIAPSTPSGWSALTDASGGGVTVNTIVFYKTSAGETSLTVSGANVLTAFAIVNGAIETSSAQGASSSSIIAPAVTALGPNRLLISAYAQNSNTATISPPGGITATSQVTNTVTMRCSYEAINNNGTTGTRTATSTVSTNWVGYNILIRQSNQSGMLLELGSAWTDNVTRATALATQDGVYVKSGDSTRKYLGTIRGSASGVCEDSQAKRFCWNWYNQVPRSWYKVEATSSWTYSTAAYQQWNNSTANQVEMVCGQSGQPVNLNFGGLLSNSAGGNGGIFAIGEDSTTTPDTQCFPCLVASPSAGFGIVGTCQLVKTATLGYHKYCALQQGTGTGTTTWYGTNGNAANYQGGLRGWTLA